MSKWARRRSLLIVGAVAALLFIVFHERLFPHSTDTVALKLVLAIAYLGLIACLKVLADIWKKI